jgi:HSP20 family protein
MASLSRWDPMREMMTLRNAMDQLFNSAFVGPDFVWESGSVGVALDVIENADEYVVKASLPGINADDIDVTFDNNVLTIKGEIKEEKDVEETKYHLRERRYGSFSRSISLPTNIKTDSIQADYADGILTLTLPKAEEAKPKRIQVHSPDMIEANVSNRKN